jgi:serine/threonine protein kinase
MPPHSAAVVLHSEVEFKEHLEENHAGMYPMSRVATMAKGAYRPAPVGVDLFDECPMKCPESQASPETVGHVRRLTPHVASHLLSLALESLPERSARSSESEFSDDDETEGKELPRWPKVADYMHRYSWSDFGDLLGENSAESAVLDYYDKFSTESPFDHPVGMARRQVTLGPWFENWIKEPTAGDTMSVVEPTKLDWIAEPPDDDPIWMPDNLDRRQTWNQVELIQRQYLPLNPAELLKEPVIKSLFRSQKGVRELPNLLRFQGHGDHYFELDELNASSFQDIPRDQRDATADDGDIIEIIPEPFHPNENEDLAEQIFQGFVLSKWGQMERGFMPEGRLAYILTEAAVQREFSSEVGPAAEVLPAKTILARAIKLLAVSLLCDIRGFQLQQAMARFLAQGFDDSNLPIANPIQSEFPDAEAFNLVFWTRSRLFRFYELQWRFLVPVFLIDDFKYYQFAAEVILPCVSIEDVSRGAFSRVFAARIHPAHCVKSKIAIKEFTESTADTSARIWEKELRNMGTLSKLHHEHIVRGLGGFTSGDRRCLLLEWADGGNLREFWRAHPSPTLGALLVQELIIQFCGLADALANLHKLNCRHGDLKPENILRFISMASVLGTLKISDFGIAKVHLVATQFRHNATTTQYTTPLYEPPETIGKDKRGLPRSRSSDIWSIGCIFLEFLIWLLYGTDSLEDLNDALGIGAQSFVLKPRSFYQVYTYGAPPIVHPAATEWIDYIRHQDPECSRWTAIRDLIDLIRVGLLVVDINERVTAEQLHTRLESIAEMARTRGANYLYTGLSRDGILHPGHRRNYSARTHRSSTRELTRSFSKSP